MGTNTVEAGRCLDRTQLLERLNQAAQRMSSILDVECLLDTVVNEITANFGLSHAIVLLRDPASDELVTAAVRGHEPKGSRFRIGRDGMVGQTAARRTAYYARDVREDPHYICCNALIRSELDVPILSEGELLGVLSMECEQVSGFNDDDVEIFTQLAEHIATGLRNSRLFEQEHNALKRLALAEEEARLVQRSLFPKKAPELPGLRLDGQCMFAGLTGGDWFDYIPLSDTRCGVVLADVSGKGMAAALLMSTTRTLLRLVAKQIGEPAELLLHLNHALLQEFPDARYVTMIYGVLDSNHATFTFANAGHPAPLLVQNGGAQFLTTQSGLPLGLLDSHYDQRTVHLTSGSKLLLYSDGVTEACGKDGIEFGPETLLAHAQSEPFNPQSLLETVSRYCLPHTLPDDATMVMIESRSQLAGEQSCPATSQTGASAA